ncbi:ribosomal protein L11 methyltransferase [Methylomagnum ishizawai]|uniref:Ribosomal protein L11 methyltransferase n=1 Tax=Methylomagnum ishizawai TaxID=1760988 RepID=A0A1Y6D294_9GAMM|nr:50S ribosomal protein L11 methyltransferase [Methylomagnum ishizawai]SMF96731.1 ribosomal protein L11 methyltransferase [Methylomagnum ishizawai]
MWQQFAVVVDESRAEPLSDLFMDLGAVSVGFEDAGDQPLFEPKPGETPLWNRTQVVALFEEGADEAAVRAAVEARFGGGLRDWRASVLEDQVWERAWLEHFKPMSFGQRLWICPTSYEPPEPDAVNVWLDPGLAFGTGTHPTTALCLEWLDGQEVAGKTVLDYGCGSGILAIAALKLGAVLAHGVDIDPQALTASADNARKNSVEAGLKLYLPKALPALEADIVLANILAGPLVELAAAILAPLRPGGGLALSGILATQADTVRAAYADRVEFAPTLVREDWALLSGVKRAG